MQVHRTAIVLCISLAFAACGRIAQADSAAEAYARGNALLQKGEYQQSLSALGEAARAQRDNREYAARYMMVRRIVQLQNRLDTETDATRWTYVAKALESFYRTERMYDQSLALSQKKYDRLKDAASAAALAETQLAMHMPAEALATLESLDDAKATPATKSLKAIALARVGKAEDAKKVADSVELSEQAGPGVLYSAARMYAATGAPERAVATLRRCLEQVSPSGLPAFRDHAKTCTDFAELASTAPFLAVLDTKSKVSESKCSGGTSCAGCPMRGNCPSSQH